MPKNVITNCNRKTLSLQIQISVMKKTFFSFLFMSVSTFALAQAAVDTKVCDKMPEFPGGNEGMSKFIGETLKYPKEAQANNIEGRVLVKFVINSRGNVSVPSIVRSASPLLDSEAIRVVRLMPRWTPGYIKEKPVPVFFTLPLVFRLEDDTPVNEKK
jgi:TonB family protein